VALAPPASGMSLQRCSECRFRTQANSATVACVASDEPYNHDLVNSNEAVRVRVMEKAELSKRFERVEHEVSQTLELISRHRNILADLGRKEVDAETIQIMLSQLEIQLVFQLQEREKLRAELTRHNG
jgi:hypothetical protein